MSESDSGDEGNRGGPKKPPPRKSKPPVILDLAAEPAAARPPPPEDSSASKPDIGPPTAPASAKAEDRAEKAALPSVDPPKHAGDPPKPAGPDARNEPQRSVSPIPPRPERPKTDWSSAGRLIAAGVFGGAIATVLGILYHASGIIPTLADLVAADALRQAQATAEKVAGFEARLAAVESATAPLAALTEKVASLEKLEDTNRSRIETLESTVAAAGSGSGDGLSAATLAPIETRLATAENTLTTLGERLGTLTGRVEEIASRPPPAVESERAARAVAIGLLRQGAESGHGFVADLSMLKALGLDGDDIAALEPLAKDGAPTVAQLQASFPGIADAILAAARAPDPDAGFIDRLFSFGGSLVTVRPTEPIEGDTPEAIVSRMQASVARGELDAALAERKKLPDTGQAASATWAGAAADRVAIDTIVGRLVQSITPPAN